MFACTTRELKDIFRHILGKFPARVATTEPGVMVDKVAAPLNVESGRWDTPLTANACSITHDILQGLCTVLIEFQGVGQ